MHFALPSLKKKKKKPMRFPWPLKRRSRIQKKQDVESRSVHPIHNHHHLSLTREGRWGTTDDFATSFLHFPCSPLLSGTWRIPDLSCLPTSSSVCLVFFPLSLCLARWFWQDLMNERHDHTTAVSVSLRWSGGLRVVRLPAGTWYGLPRW